MKLKILLLGLGVLAAASRAMPPVPGVTMPAGMREQWQKLGIDVPKDPIRDKGKKGIFNSAQTGFRTLVSGTKKFPVVLIQYPDQDSAYPKAEFQNMLFGTWSSGTATDYYQEVSYSQLSLTGNVYGWYRSDSNKAYYGYVSGDPTALIREAASKSDSAVNYADYDNDGDGYVDCFTVLHSGMGMEESGDGTDIWSHMWYLSGSGTFFTTNDPDPHHPGEHIKIDLYTCDPERSNTTNHGTMACIGVFCHEWGHALGLPDLYDTDGGGAGLGLWCLMAAGSWGGDYRSPWSPVQLSAWGKIALGWLSPTVVTGSATHQLKQIEDNKEVYKLWEGGNPQKEYFLVENRQKTKFDQNLQGSGLLIYHIDEDIIAARGPYNQVNAGGGMPYGVALEQADGRDELESGTNVGNGSDPFPGTKKNTAFDSAFTNPNSNSNSGAYTTCGVNTISNSSATMSAFFYVGSGGSDRFKFADHNIGNCVLTVNENGAIGFTNSAQNGGSGFKYPAYGQNWLFYASMAAGNSTSYVVDNYYDVNGRDDQDFQVSLKPDGRLRFITPPQRSDQDILGFYDDRGHPLRKGLSVRQLSMAYKNSADNDFVIIEYTFKNNDSLPLNGFYTGEFADFDMGSDPTTNSAAIDSIGRIAYTWQGSNTNPHVGIKLLSPTTASNVSVFDNATYVHPFGGLPDSLQFRFLAGSKTIPSVAGTDASEMVSAGPFDLAPGDSITVAFAFVGGPILGALKANGDSAQAIYTRRRPVAEHQPVAVVSSYRLRPFTPNPFSTATTIHYQVLGTAGTVCLRIYDATGRAVRDFSKVVNRTPGVYQLRWDGRDGSGRTVPAGIYFCQLRADELTLIQKVIRLK
jgi:M6 family metalloprotease-like protein